jgi:hypothetical protein
MKEKMQRVARYAGLWLGRVWLAAGLVVLPVLALLLAHLADDTAVLAHLASGGTAVGPTGGTDGTTIP